MLPGLEQVLHVLKLRQHGAEWAGFDAADVKAQKYKTRDEAEKELNARLAKVQQPKPEAADLNRRLIEAVFQELHTKAPDGVHYMVLRLADGTAAFVTIHPSWLLRMEDEADKEREYKNFVADLRPAAKVLEKKVA